MAIIALFKNEKVEILDTFDLAEGKQAAFRALAGKPFVGGDKWPIFTEWATAPAGELANVHQESTNGH